MVDIKQSLSEREKTLVLNNSPLLMDYQDIDHNVIWVNERAGRSVSEELSDLHGRKCYEIFYGREQPCEGCPIDESWESGESQTGEVKSPDDRVCEIRGKPVEDDEGNIIGAVETIFDITEQKQMKEKLKASEERYRRLFETAQDGMLILDAETGRIEDANPYIKNLLGFSKEDLVGKELWQIGTFRDVAENKERFQELVEEGYIRYEDLPLETKSGGEASVEFVSNTYMAGGKRVVQCNIRDTTARKEAEEREKFLHSLLRHDVKNKSQIVKGYLQILKDYELPDEVREYIEKAEKATDEGVDLIEKVTRLREIKESSDISAVKVGSVLEMVTSEFEDQLQEKGIEITLQKCDYKVEGGALFEELFSNLIGNSIQHSDCDEIRIVFQVQDEECVVTIEDDGSGIPDKVKEKVFEKGFKSGDDAGTGLGLYMVRKIAETYGGSVEVKDSELGGARFEIHLKRVR